ncbi:glycosyltransferase family 2 protein [Aquiflexum gelatinilyticum]|uniref:Glycosyltransferase family 2 protein n=1 Tax=Aquiflexum gelatinilyticum TaxID=2961943 RepID=A0A9X2P4V0_9BACT|nr:glycosyltransferase family 2 protein [Aquiflexum gelatinilyticum]MCR9014851.1 glycosyltransferase family 2 protein [Aquiflexum gelatinilyticum]
MSANIYCVIVTYNGMTWLPKTLSSIRESHYPLKTIIVDNGSTDVTCDFISEAFPEMHLIQNKTNLGFGKANNLGAKFAMEEGAEYIFLLNQDAYLDENTISRCLAGFGFGSKIGLVSPVHLNGKGEGLDFGFQSCLTEGLCPGFVSDMTLKKTKPFYPIYSVNAAAWLLDASIIKEIGLFSESFFHYGEDINFQQRLRYFGYQAVLVPGSYIRHDRDQRKGEKTKIGKVYEIKTNQMTILLNVNEPFDKAIKKVFKYAGLLFFEGKLNQSVKVLIDTLWNQNIYKKQRNELMRGIPL